MPTLNQIRKSQGKYKSYKAFAEALNITPNQAANWLRGCDPSINPEPLFKALGLSQDEYHAAYEATREDEEAKWRMLHPPKSQEKWEAELKASADAIYAKMTPADKRRIHEDAVRLGITGRARSPIDILIDQACKRIE